MGDPAAPARSHSSTLSPTPALSSRYGRFALERFHAKGGLGEVHVAVDEELHRTVALKRMQDRFAADAGATRRFLNEAEITARLEHPGIVPIYGLAHDEHGLPCYAMRFIEGESLSEAIKRFHNESSKEEPPHKDEPPGLSRRAGGDKPRRSSDFGGLAFRQLLQRFVSVCNTIAYAHSKQVIHRDLKPANIMLGPFGETLVVDWGLAREFVPSRQPERPEEKTEEDLLPSTVHFTPSGSGERVYTQAGEALGTLGYMAPEQAAGRWNAVGPCSDIYSLGATLYEILTGERAIRGQDHLQALQRAQAATFPPPRKINPNVPKALEAICHKAMALEPEDRCGSVKQLAEDLEHWLADEPMSAYAEPWLARSGRWARKHRALVATAAAVLLTAILGLTVAMFLLSAEKNRTERARQAADQQRIAAEQNEARAKTEAAKATAIKDFLQRDLLQFAAPRMQQGPDAAGIKMDPELKVRDLVLRAAKKIDGKFPDQPLVEAEIRWTLGWTLLDIGRADVALAQWTRVRGIFTAKLGAEHLCTLLSTTGLASSYRALGRYSEALELSEENVQRCKTALGLDHPETMTSMTNLALCYADLGRHADALKLHEQTLELRKAKLRPKHPDTLKSMNNIAASYWALGRRAEALKIHEQVFHLREAELGENHPDTLWSMNNLGVSYEFLGRHAEAAEVHERALSLRKVTLGVDHPDTLTSMNNLGSSYYSLSRYADAAKLHEEALRIRKVKLGVNHPDTVMSMGNLACNLVKVDRAAEAVPIIDEFMKLSAETAVPPHLIPLVMDARLRHFENSKDAADCRATAEMWANLRRTDAGSLYTLAAMRAVTVAVVKADPKTPAADADRLAKEEADRAMVWLQRAVAAGYKDVEHMKQDKDLDALREREDYKKVVKELEEK